MDIFDSWLETGRRKLLVRAGILTAVIALVDWRLEDNISFGFLYLFPMLLVGSVSPRWQIVMAAGVCTVLEELFDPFPWMPGAASIPQDILVFSAFVGMGMFACEMAKNRHLTRQHMREMESEVELRREAEVQLEILIESSPAAIVMLNQEGTVLMANEAAHKLFGYSGGNLFGESIRQYLPALASVPAPESGAQVFRTVMEGRGRRRDGELFLAQICFSTYSTRSGPRLAAMIIDASEGLRDSEEFNLERLLAGSRILVGAVSHEIRNLCSAISMVRAKMAQNPALAGNEDFIAFAGLIDALERIASTELRQTAGEQLGEIDLHAVLDELRIIIGPSFQKEWTLRWQIPDQLPRVGADRHMLLQVFLNLVQNSQRALENWSRKELTISAAVEASKVMIRFSDSGPGIADPERLFQPFQRGAESSGLGLFLSRAFVRRFRGELRLEPQPQGCCFLVELVVAPNRKQVRDLIAKSDDPASGIGRSYALSGKPGLASRR
jgi:PAS domain S-box-containing protein